VWWRPTVTRTQIVGRAIDSRTSGHSGRVLAALLPGPHVFGAGARNCSRTTNRSAAGATAQTLEPLRVGAALQERARSVDNRRLRQSADRSARTARRVGTPSRPTSRQPRCGPETGGQPRNSVAQSWHGAQYGTAHASTAAGGAEIREASARCCPQNQGSRLAMMRVATGQPGRVDALQLAGTPTLHTRLSAANRRPVGAAIGIRVGPGHDAP
jgi:hypothetical protein